MHRPGAYSLLLLLLTACIPYGFTGGGLPSHVRTVAIVPFENQTATPELPRELTDALRTRLHDRLGLRDASESKASSIVRGAIQRYEIDIPVGYSANNRQSTTARRMLGMASSLLTPVMASAACCGIRAKATPRAATSTASCFRC